VVKVFPTVDLIIIVDNMSTDDSVAMLKPLESDKIVLVCAKENRGYAAGNNVGLQYIIDHQIKGNIIISNPDIYYNNEDLEKVLTPLKDPLVGITTGLIHTDGVVTSNFGWMLPGYWELLINQYLLLYKLKRLTHNSIYCDYPKEGEEYVYCNCVSGCFFCMTTETLEQIGLFDERTFLYGEENILGFKIKNNGQKACIVTAASIEHRQHHSIKKSKASYKRNEGWKLESFLVYIKYYLKKNQLHQLIFKISFWLAYCEKNLIEKIMNWISKL
jgi:GT2 family glycosyltransferase